MNSVGGLKGLGVSEHRDENLGMDSLSISDPPWGGSTTLEVLEKSTFISSSFFLWFGWGSVRLNGL